MQKLCVVCGKPFTPPEENPYKKTCSPKCHEEKYFPKKEPKKQPPPPPKTRVQSMSIDDVLRWAERYYKKTGKRLWYGMAVARIEAEDRVKTKQK